MSRRVVATQVIPTQPFDFAKTLTYLRSSAGAALDDVGPAHFRKAVRMGGTAGLLTVTAGATGGRPTLTVQLAGPGLRPQSAAAAAALVQRIFCTDAVVAGVETAGSRDPVFARVLDQCRGVRPVLLPTVFETLCWAITGQQINVAFAAKCKRALVERYGDVLTEDGRAFHLFPTPERLAALSPGDLAPLQFSRQKARYITGLARAVCEGGIDLEALPDTPAEAALDRLLALDGVGRWTAEYVLLRGLGHRDSIPAGDGGLRRIIGRHYGLGRNATEAEVRALAEAWAPWRGYAALYWWFTLQAEERSVP